MERKTKLMPDGSYETQFSIPAPVIQGTCVVERDELQAYLVMTPDGEVRWASTAIRAQQLCRDYFRKLGDEFGIGKIEWRGVPENLIPRV